MLKTMLGDLLLSNLKTQQARQEQLFEQISSNKRILRASDDPYGTAEVLGIRDNIERNKEYESGYEN